MCRRNAFVQQQKRTNKIHMCFICECVCACVRTPNRTSTHGSQLLRCWCERCPARIPSVTWNIYLRTSKCGRWMSTKSKRNQKLFPIRERAIMFVSTRWSVFLFFLTYTFANTIGVMLLITILTAFHLGQLITGRT